jgi:serine protease AprX
MAGKAHTIRTRHAIVTRVGLIVISLVAAGLGAAAPPGEGFAAAQGEHDREEAQQPVLLRLKYGTFDPLEGEPDMPASLHLDAYAGEGEGAYIVQFQGPIQEEWKERVAALGGRVMDYVPDYSFLVWMDGATLARVENLEIVRWVGLYQPAYKFRSDLDRSKPHYRVVLFEGVDLAAVEAHLTDLNTPTERVSAEQFTVLLPDGNVEDLAVWPEVLWIEEQPFYRANNDVAAGIMQAAVPWGSGYNGSGMTVAVSDTGIDSGLDTPAPGDIHPDFDNRMAQISSWPVVDDGCFGCCWNTGADDGADDVDTGHGTHVLGSLAGNGAASGGQFKGLAFQSSLTFQAVEQWVDFTPYCEGFPYYYDDGYYLLGIPDDIGDLFQEAYDWGARVHSNSWGSDADGEYTIDAQAVDQFVWDHRDMTILFSAGNAGVDSNWDGYVDQDSIGSPASAKNCITSGASDNVRDSGGYNPGGLCWTWWQCWPLDFPMNPTRDDRISDTQEELAAFSSRGPTDDGRRKPDVVAPGTNIVSARSHYASGTLWGVYNAEYLYSGGTSMSNPLIAGAATLVREYYVEGQGHTPSAALVKATLTNSAVDVIGYGNSGQEGGQPVPNNHEGWGRVDVGAATSGERRFRDGHGVITGGSQLYFYEIDASAIPLKVTLAWSDYPGSLPTGGTVNNLDLVVVSPGGTQYRGNSFSNGWSVPGGGADNVNNVESVYIQNPQVGLWTVRVEGANVPQGPQPFALVLTGSFGPGLVYDYLVYLPLVLKTYPEIAPTPPPDPGGWVTIKSEDFEGTFPGSWDVSDNNSIGGSYYWGKRTCRPSGGGGDGSFLPCGNDYPNNVEGWMVYGPFSLADAGDAELTFKLWLDVEYDYDVVFRGASIDGYVYYGWSATGYSAGWVDSELDLTMVPTLGDLTGEPDVWIALVFFSDSSTAKPEGAYVDDILLHKYVGTTAAPPTWPRGADPPTLHEEEAVLTRNH